MFFAFISLLQGWATVNLITEDGQEIKSVTPLFNIRFLTSLLFIASFGFISYLNHNSKYQNPFESQKELKNLISISISACLLITIYYSFQLEISDYWDRLYNASLVELTRGESQVVTSYHNSDLIHFKNIWLINYTLLFLSVLSIINIRKLRSSIWGYINLVLNAFSVIIFLLFGLYILSELRDSYLNQTLSEYYHRGIFNVGIRYISFVFAAIILWSTRMYTDQPFLKPSGLNLKQGYDILLYVSLIWIISSELISWMDIKHYSQSYKLVLSILWGVYALFLIAMGIWKKKKHLRIIAIMLFALTLLKLFFYDLSQLNTISKTIVFVTLGILLLIISFLYNKYKNAIAGETLP